MYGKHLEQCLAYRKYYWEYVTVINVDITMWNCTYTKIIHSVQYQRQPKDDIWQQSEEEKMQCWQNRVFFSFHSFCLSIAQSSTACAGLLS